jgi:hypothetical protein
MTKMSDINDNEIRVIGGDGGGGGKKRLPWWVWVIVGVVAVAIAVVALWPKPQPEEPTVPDTTTVTEPETTDIWHSNTDNSLPSCTIVTDTLIDTLHLRIFTPYNATPELHIGRLDTANTDIILAAMAADLRRDNGRIVGAFVHAGEPLSWGLSKRGYCAIFDGQITIGVAENSPLFEQATEQGGYFFRQYPAVDKGVMVENNPENASFRRALCLLNGKVCIIACTDRVLMNDFSATLVKLGVSEAILLVGGTADGWCRTDDGKMMRLGSSYAQNAKYMNHIVFRKQ